MASVLLFNSYRAEAVVAYPEPVRISQPDGSSLMIQIHGDEFLHYTTWNNYLVATKSDGYLYFAKYNSDGEIVATDSRVVDGISKFAVPAGNIPEAAKLKASAMREEYIKNDDNTYSQMPVTKASGRSKYLVLMIQFSDKTFTYGTSAFGDLLNGDSNRNYTTNGGTGSVRKYYYDNSLGALDLEYDILGPYTANVSATSFTGGGTEMAVFAAFSAVVDANRDAITSAGYTILSVTSGSNTYYYVPNMFIYFAGYNQAEGVNNTIWPHRRGSYYACTSELKGTSGTTMCGIGTCCHEFGHTLGLPDYYDTDYTDNGQGKALGYYSLMSSGNYNNSGKTPPYLDYESRKMLGWEPEVKSLAKGNYSIQSYSQAVDTCFKAYKIPTSNMTGDGEYFIIENRSQTEWDAYIPGEGLLIYHVDKSTNAVSDSYVSDYPTAQSRWLEKYNINTYSTHPCYDIVAASTAGMSYWTYPGSSNTTSFTPSDWAGNSLTAYSLTNISRNSTTGAVSFTIANNSTFTLSGKVYVEGTAASGAVVTLTQLGYADLEAVQTKITAQTTTSYSATTASDGSYSFSTAMNSGDYSITITSGTTNEVFFLNAITGAQTKDFYIGETLEIHNYTGLLDKNIGETGRNGYMEYLQDSLYSKYEGYSITSIKCYGVTAECTDYGVFLTDDSGEVTYIRQVGTGNITTMNINADISDLSLTLGPSFAGAFGVGVYFNGVSNTPSIYAQELTGNTAYCYTDLVLSEGLSNRSFGISITLTPPSELAKEKGVVYIVYDPTAMNANSSYTLALTSLATNPSGYVWYVDGTQVSTSATDTITLTSGAHTIRAELTYADGSKETVIQEIYVK